MQDLPSREELEAVMEQRRDEFINAELALCFTFADLVETEWLYGHAEAAARVLCYAERGYAMLARFLKDIRDPNHKREIERRFSVLSARLDALKMAA